MPVPNFLLNMDWAELKNQKLELLDAIGDYENFYGNPNPERAEALSGILHAIDAMQDYAVDGLGIDEITVFGYETDKHAINNQIPEPVIADNDPYVCSNCGSINVENKVWVNANTGVISGGILDEDDDNDCWCDDCQEHHELILKSEFDNNN